MSASWAAVLRLIAPESISTGAAFGVACTGIVAFALGIATLERDRRMTLTAVGLIFAGLGVWLTHKSRRYGLAAHFVTVPAMLAIAWIVYRRPGIRVLVLGAAVVGSAIIAGVAERLEYRFAAGATSALITLYLSFIIRRMNASSD